LQALFIDIDHVTRYAEKNGLESVSMLQIVTNAESNGISRKAFESAGRYALMPDLQVYLSQEIHMMASPEA
jgi:hypothetical protein